MNLSASSATTLSGQPATVPPINAIKSRRRIAAPDVQDRAWYQSEPGLRKWLTDVRFGSEADIEARLADVRFTPKADIDRSRFHHLIGCTQCDLRDAQRKIFDVEAAVGIYHAPSA